MRIAVIGAGVFGSWSAWFLNAAGHTVTLIDQYGPANARASSADHSRVIRCGYGADEIYSRWARASLEDWHWLAREVHRELVVTSGALFLGAAGDSYITSTQDTLTRLGIAAEVLDGHELRRRFPQIDVTGVGAAVYEPTAAVLRARVAVQALVAMMQERRAVAYRTVRVAPPDENDSQPRWRIPNGEMLTADAIICACGPWLPTLLPNAVGARIRPTRQEVLHFGVPAGSEEFSLPRLPVWIDFQAGVYGIPDLDARGFKIGIDQHGATFDPDREDRSIDSELIDRTRRWIGTRFPALRDAPFVDGHVCQYENTATGDFLIDRHPRWPNVWIVGGGSGHGFKHGPAIGRYVASLVVGDTVAEPRFSWSRKHTIAQRSVY